MLIELHLIQNFAPSNLNRDDTGNPKDAEFGGVRRARISSQAFKRAIREHDAFKDTTQVPASFLTKKLGPKLLELMKEAQPDIPLEAAEIVTHEFARVFSSKKGKMDEKSPEKTSVLIFLADAELQQIAQQLLALPLESLAEQIKELDEQKFKKPEQRMSKSPLKKLANDWSKQTENRTSAPDIALFGRMLADRPEINLDAACQVAHAISTHRVSMDLDFFTAVDDLQRHEETGSAHMNTTAFNSACFYRYIAIDWGQLVKNLDDDRALARKTVEGFLRAALQAIPSGKQNAFAAQNPPDFVLAVRNAARVPRSLANAFEKPVRPDREGGLVEPSIRALDEYWARLAAVYGQDGLEPAVLSVRPADTFPNLQGAAKANLEDWLQSVLHGLGEE